MQRILVLATIAMSLVALAPPAAADHTAFPVAFDAATNYDDAVTLRA